MPLDLDAREKFLNEAIANGLRNIEQLKENIAKMQGGLIMIQEMRTAAKQDEADLAAALALALANSASATAQQNAPPKDIGGNEA